MSEVEWLSPKEQEAWRSLLRGSVALLDRLNEELQREHGLSLPEYEMLAHLSSVPGRRLRMSDLSKRALLSKSRLTHAVDRLQSRGLVSRQRCDLDRRGFFTVLTPAGMRLLEQAAPTHVAGVRHYLIECVSVRDLAAVGRALECVLVGIEEAPRREVRSQHSSTS